MKLGMLDTAGFLDLLRRWQGTGYSNDDDSLRVAELDGVASVAAHASEALDEAVGNMFASSADEALDEYDRLLSMPTDSQITTAQRQARLVAFMRALPKLIEARLDGALDSWLGTSNGVTVAPTINEATRHGCSAMGGLSAGRLQPSATTATLRVVDAIMRRGMPARAIGCRGGNHYADYATVADRAIFRSAYPSPPLPNGMVPEVPTAPLEQYPGSVLTNDVYREMQAQLLWKPYRGGTGTGTNHFSVQHSSLGGTIYVSGSLAAGATAAVDNNALGGWDNRVVQAWLVVHTGPFTDSGVVSTHGYLSASKLGDFAATVYTKTLVGSGIATDLQFGLNASNDLTITNTSGATRYFKGFIRRSPKFFRDTTHDREPWVSTANLDSGSVIDMLHCAAIRNPTSSSHANIITQGPAVRRIFYTGAMQREFGGDTPSLVVLDSSMDWRNRALLVTPITAGSTVVKEASSTQIAGQTANSAVSSDVLSRVFLTNSGAGADDSTVSAYQFPLADLTNSQVDIWIWADSTNGWLMAEMKALVSSNAYACSMFSVTATGRLGTPDGSSLISLPYQVPQAIPADFNLPQNWGCFAQGQATAGQRLTSPPLGTVVDGGLPARPVSWLVRERRGDPTDRLVESRQRIYGQRRRLISLSVANGTTVDVDACSVVPQASASTLDQMDYRDRLVVVEGRFSAVDISLGAVVQSSDTGSTRFSWVFYGGPYGDQSFTMDSGNLVLAFVFGRNGDDAFQSRLTVTNNTGSTRYINFAIEATGFLGLTDRRLDGAAA